jgi:hypothetical protein
MGRTNQRWVRQDGYEFASVRDWNRNLRYACSAHRKLGGVVQLPYGERSILGHRKKGAAGGDQVKTADSSSCGRGFMPRRVGKGKVRVKGRGRVEVADGKLRV